MIWDSTYPLFPLIVENKLLENKSGRIFAFDKFTLQILPTNLGACKPTFYTFYTSHLRWKSTEALFLSYRPQTIGSQFHNFSRQIAFIQYSGPSKHAWAFSETVQKNSKITYQVCKEILTELRFNIIKNLLCLFFIDSFMTMCNFKKRLISAAVVLQAMFMNDWKQTAKWWKLQETTNNK